MRCKSANPGALMRTRNVIGVLFGTAVALAAICAGTIFFTLENAEDSIAPRIDQFLVALDRGLAGDLYDSVLNSDDLRASISKERYEEICKTISSKLGNSKSKSLRRLGVWRTNNLQFAEVRYRLFFERGEATLYAKLARKNDEWQFLNVQIKSTSFE